MCQEIAEAKGTGMMLMQAMSGNTEDVIRTFRHGFVKLSMKK